MRMARFVGRLPFSKAKLSRNILFCHDGKTPGEIHHRSGGVAPTIRLGLDDTAGGVLARGDGGDARCFLL